MHSITESTPLPGTTRIPGGTFEHGDEIQMWGELHKVHSTRPGDRRGEVRLTLETKRGTAGWTVIVQAGLGYLGKKKPTPFAPGTVVVIGGQSYLRQVHGWASKGGRSILSDGDMRSHMSHGEAKVVFEPQSVVEDDFDLEF